MPTGSDPVGIMSHTIMVFEYNWKSMDLSLIVPVYKQERTIVKDLKRILKTLTKTPYQYEVIAVVDGEVDDSTKKIKTIKDKNLKLISYKQNHGKGYAIWKGLRKARGKYVAFIDSGMEIDPEGIIMLMEHMRWYDADIMVGSKRHPVSQVYYPPLRRFLSWGYSLFVRLLFGVKVKDTQAGLKIFRKEMMDEVLPVLLVKRYAFDIEILAVARRFGYTKIYEGPIKLDYQFDSLVSAASMDTIWRMLVDTLAVFYRLNILRYYEKKRLNP